MRTFIALVLATLLGTACASAQPTPPPVTPEHSVPYLLGAYTENAPATVAAIGRPLDFVISYAAFYDEGAWRDGGTEGLEHLAPGQKTVYDIYTTWKGGSMAEAAAGHYNAYYDKIVHSMMPYASRIVAIRIDSEFNGPWEPWYSENPEHSAQAFRNLASYVRKYMPQVKIIWNPNIGHQNPIPAYPGNKFVDLIGLDVYLQKEYFGDFDAKTRWQHVRDGGGPFNGVFGLDEMARFADKMGKPMAFPEWGSEFDDGCMIAELAEWSKTHNVALVAFWDSEGGASTSFSQHPVNLATFRKVWGQSRYSGTYWRH